MCRWRAAQRRLNVRTNADLPGEPLYFRLEENVFLRCRADCKNSMGFKELTIHTGSLHNTIGMALKRGMKKYSHLFLPFSLSSVNQSSDVKVANVASSSGASGRG